MMFTKVLETFLKDFGPLNDGIAQLLQIWPLHFHAVNLQLQHISGGFFWSCHHSSGNLWSMIIFSRHLRGSHTPQHIDLCICRRGLTRTPICLGICIRAGRLLSLGYEQAGARLQLQEAWVPDIYARVYFCPFAKPPSLSLEYHVWEREPEGVTQRGQNVISWGLPAVFSYRARTDLCCLGRHGCAFFLSGSHQS